MWPFDVYCHSKQRMVGKTVVITGGNCGIGRETARDLYWRGARVVIACRNLDKANEAVEDIKKNPPSKPHREQFQGKQGELVVFKLNLCSLASVRECAKGILDSEPSINVLINNAGVMMCPLERTEDGYECHLQTNHLSHFLFTLLLLPRIIASRPGCRIINVASRAHIFGRMYFEDLNFEKSYTPLKAYAQSKWSNILFTRELVDKFKEAGIDGITTYCLHPGVISTELGRHLDKSVFPGINYFFKNIGKSAEVGAQTNIHLAVDEKAGKETGMYYNDCHTVSPDSRTRNKEEAVKLWNLSLKMVGLPPKENLNELLKAISQDIPAAS